MEFTNILGNSGSGAIINSDERAINTSLEVYVN